MQHATLRQSILATTVPWAVAIGLTVLAARAAGAADAFATYQVIDQQTVSIPLPVGQLWKTEMLVQDGDNPLNRFGITYIRRPHLLTPRKPLVLLLALGNNARVYQVSEDNDIKKSFAGFFARLGFDVWLLTLRSSLLQAGDCGVALDCTPVLDWGLDTIIKDTINHNFATEKSHVYFCPRPRRLA